VLEIQQEEQLEELDLAQMLSVLGEKEDRLDQLLSVSIAKRSHQLIIARSDKTAPFSAQISMKSAVS
jgi:hypothetical protein